MELKMKYHSSYFIYPYVIKKRNLKKYIERLLASSKFKPKFFARERESSIYQFFLPNIRTYLFKSFEFAEENQKGSYEKLKENLFKASPCMIFEYDIGKDAQAKITENEGIFFRVDKIEVICFQTGICFLSIKTNLEDTNRFADLLNFHVKFRQTPSEITGSEAYSNIKIQTSTFGDIRKLSEIIREITGSMQEAKRIDMDVNRFLIYSYVCLDQEYWNDTRPFSDLQKEFFKLTNVLTSEYYSSFENQKLKTVDLGKYIKVGISKAGVNFITSSIHPVNYTNLPFEFEHEYFYTYLFTLYEKFYLAKIMNGFGKHIKVWKTSKEFIKFTNQLWVHELTTNDNGSLIFDTIKDVLELKGIYEKEKEHYDIAYKDFKMKNNDMLNKMILVLLAISIITNIVNFINIYHLK